MLSHIGSLVPTQPYETGEVCVECGKTLFAVDFPGKRRIDIQCHCKLEKISAQDRALREAQQRDRIQGLFRASNLPELERKCRLDNFEIRDKSTSRALKICRNYTARFEEIRRAGRGMFLYGNSGSGKTHLAAGIANDLLARGYSVRYQDVNDLYSRIRSTYSRTSEESEADYVGPCLSSALLILDDLGAENPTEWTMATMHHIINSRIDSQKPTIITSNLLPEDLQDTLTSRTVNRILDTTSRYFEPIRLVCDSYRTRGKEQSS